MGLSPVGQRLQGIQHQPQNALNIGHYIRVGNPENMKTQRFQPRCAPCIGGRIGMRVAVYFQHKSLLRAEKINDCTADCGLPAKFEAA